MTHPLFDASHTIGDLYNAVLAIHDANDARAFYVDYVAWLEVQPDLSHSADAVAKANIGWLFGEGMPPENIRMWVEVCGASHPIFGTMQPRPTPEQAFKAGLERGLRA